MTFAMDHRLYLTEGQPYTHTSNATTLYLGPAGKGNCIAYYVGSSWIDYHQGEISISNAGLTPNTMVDIFSYPGALEFDAWSDLVTIPTRDLQDGVLVKHGDPTRRFLGSAYIDGNGNFNNYTGLRALWNFYNQTLVKCQAWDNTESWVETSSAIHPMNNNTNYGQGRFGFCTGIAMNGFELFQQQEIFATGIFGAAGDIGYGIDSTTAFSNSAIPYIATANASAGGGTNVTVGGASNENNFGGFHYVQRLCCVVPGQSVTFYGGAPIGYITGLIAC